MVNSNDWHTGILASHEERQGLSHDQPWPGDEFPGVALPSSKAYGLWVQLRWRVPATINCECHSKTTLAQVWDNGPWLPGGDDDAYVLGIARPKAEGMLGQIIDTNPNKPGIQPATVQGQVVRCNGAGIDLFPRVARQLGILIGNNVLVDWRFVDMAA